MLPVDFAIPQVLFLLPLALLPLVRRHRDNISFPSLTWIPTDAIGSLVHTLWCALAVLTLATLIVGLAKPGRSENQIERIGRGAELSILMDRSASMDCGELII